MTTVCLNWIIISGTALVAVLAFSNEIADHTRLTIFNNIIFKIVLIAITFIVIGWATIKKDNVSDENTKTQLGRREAKNKADFQRTLKSSDSFLISKYTDALARWGLKLDSSNSEISKKISDSALGRNIPYLEVFRGAVDSFRLDQERLSFKVFAMDFQNTAYHTDLTLHSFMKVENSYIDAGEVHMYNDESIPSTGIKKDIIFTSNALPIVDSIFIIFNGTYNNYYQTIKPVPHLLQVCVLVLKERTLYGIGVSQNEFIYDFIKGRHWLSK